MDFWSVHTVPLCMCSAQGAVHMVATRLGCKGVVVDTARANSHPGCMNELRKCYSHFVGGLFLAGRAGCVMKECLPAENTDYMFVNE